MGTHVSLQLRTKTAIFTLLQQKALQVIQGLATAWVKQRKLSLNKSNSDQASGPMEVRGGNTRELAAEHCDYRVISRKKDYLNGESKREKHKRMDQWK